jgi:hypothetical protein
VIIDPVTAYFGTGRNSWKDEEVRAVLGSVGASAQRTGVSIICIIHLGKDRSKGTLHRVLGIVAFTAVARVVLAVGKRDDDSDPERRLLLHVKNNLSKPAAGLAFRITDGQAIVWETDTIDALAPMTCSAIAGLRR